MAALSAGKGCCICYAMSVIYMCVLYVCVWLSACLHTYICLLCKSKLVHTEKENKTSEMYLLASFFWWEHVYILKQICIYGSGCGGADMPLPPKYNRMCRLLRDSAESTSSSYWTNWTTWGSLFQAHKTNLYFASSKTLFISLYHWGGTSKGEGWQHGHRPAVDDDDEQQARVMSQGSRRQSRCMNLEEERTDWTRQPLKVERQLALTASQGL